jgi:hypothetical protein
MTDHIFPVRTYVRVDIDPPAWVIVEAGRTLATIRPYTTFATYQEAVAAGFEGDEPEPVDQTADRLAALENAVDDLILAALEADNV